MFKKLKTLFGLRSQSKQDPQPDLVKELTDRFMQELAQANANQLTPKEVKFIFEFIRDLLLDWALQRHPTFDLHVLQARDSELYWRLVDAGVRVEKQTQPVRAEEFKSFLHEYALLFGDAAALTEAKTDES